MQPAEDRYRDNVDNGFGVPEVRRVPAQVVCDNKEVVMALREIAAGQVTIEEPKADE